MEDNFTLSKVLSYHQAQLNHLSQCLKEGDAALPTASQRGNERNEHTELNLRNANKNTSELKGQIEKATSELKQDVQQIKSKNAERDMKVVKLQQSL